MLWEQGVMFLDDVWDCYLLRHIWQRHLDVDVPKDGGERERTVWRSVVLRGCDLAF
jgi:hypothetical protein